MIGTYSTAPLLAWAGWRLRVPGGPVGGQYHGYLASDDIVDGYGWPAGHQEIYRPMDNPQNLGHVGIYPWHHWDHGWHGTPLREGETVSDFVYRSPAETRPRANASGGINVVRAVQQERTPGYAVAPGNYRTLGAMPSFVADQPILAGPDQPGFNPYHAICPAWGCGGPRFPFSVQPLPPASPAPAPVVAQPPPPTSPQPSPTVSMDGCAVGQYRDAAGNCTSDWRNPYPMYLPLDSPVSPAPTVAASTSPTGVCPTGYGVDQYGNCVVSGVAPSGLNITSWLGSQTQIGSLQVPNYVLLAGFVLVAMKFMHTGGAAKK